MTSREQRQYNLRADAENDAVLQSLRFELLEQDLRTIRRICETGGTVGDVLKFLNTKCNAGERDASNG